MSSVQSLENSARLAKHIMQYIRGDLWRLLSQMIRQRFTTPPRVFMSSNAPTPFQASAQAVGTCAILMARKQPKPQDNVRRQLGLPVSHQPVLTRTQSFIQPQPQAAAAAAAPEEDEKGPIPVVEPELTEAQHEIEDGQVIDLTASDDDEPKAPEPKKQRKSPTEGKSKLIYYEKVYVKQNDELVEAYVKKVAFVHPEIIWGNVVHKFDAPEVVDLM